MSPSFHCPLAKSAVFACLIDQPLTEYLESISEDWYRKCAHLQPFISNPSLGAPDTIDAVTSKYPNGFSALGSCSGETELAFVVLWHSVRELLFGGSVNFARTFEYESVRAIFVVGRATLACFEPDNTSVMSEKRVYPPTF